MSNQELMEKGLEFASDALSYGLNAELLFSKKVSLDTALDTALEATELIYQGKETILKAVDCLTQLVDAFPKWIPILTANDLPKKDEYDWVLVQAKLVPENHYSLPHVAELRKGVWYGMGYPEDIPLEETCGVKVTHWMPLPEYPEVVI